MRAPSVILATLLLAASLPAHAHGVLRHSEPAARSHLLAGPREIRLTFNEAPTLAFTRITLHSPRGDVALGAVRIEKDTIAVADVVGRLVPGTYRVAWQIAGADGHPVRGEFEFSIAANAAGLRPDLDPLGGEPGAGVPAPTQSVPSAEHRSHASRDGPRAFDAESPAFVAIRALLYFAIAGVAGAVTFSQLLVIRSLGAATARHPVHVEALGRAASTGMWSARVALVAILLRLVAQSYAMHGDRAFHLAPLSSMLAQTLWGWGWIVQLLASLVAERAFAVARNAGAANAPNWRQAWAVATFAAIVLCLTPALASHAAAAPRLAPLAIAADGVHVLAAGAWMGTLLLLLIAGIPAAVAHRDTPTAVAWVRAFSPIALTSGAVLAVTGAFAGWLHIGAAAGLWSTPYGRMLLVKLAVLGAAGAIGFFNWRVVLPRLEHDGELRMLSRPAAAELAFGMLVLVVTAVLVALPMS